MSKEKFYLYLKSSLDCFMCHFMDAGNWRFSELLAKYAEAPRHHHSRTDAAMASFPRRIGYMAHMDRNLKNDGAAHN